MLAHTFLPILCLAAAAAAQQNHNPVVRENWETISLSPTRHPVTQRQYNWPPLSPAAYVWTSGTTVAAGTLTARWLPSMVDLRREPRRVSGFRLGLMTAAASVAPAQSGYVPALRIHVPRQSLGQPGQTWTQGAQFQPDPSQPPLLLQAQGTFTFPQPGVYTVTRTLATPVTITVAEMVLSAEWRGGENDNLPGSQSLAGDIAGISSPTTVCFVDPPPANTITPYNDGASQNVSHPFLSYLEEAPVIVAASNWGRRTAPPQTGANAATAFSDLAGNAGVLGWDCTGGVGHAGERCILLFNLGPVVTAPFVFAGQTFELNAADPNLGLLAPFYNAMLDATGRADLPAMMLPSLGVASLGTNFGAEFLLLDATATTFTGTTQSSWVTVVR